ATLSTAEFRHAIVAQGSPGASSLWHKQQKNPPFVLLDDLYKH
ncbi:PTS sugar transporter subunit IIA, partial [Escherichia coli]|nr:PTS sugar transporter subunit IIA [Escherichia coli]